MCELADEYGEVDVFIDHELCIATPGVRSEGQTSKGVDRNGEDECERNKGQTSKGVDRNGEDECERNEGQTSKGADDNAHDECEQTEQQASNGVDDNTSDKPEGNQGEGDNRFQAQFKSGKEGQAAAVENEYESDNDFVDNDDIFLPTSQNTEEEWNDYERGMRQKKSTRQTMPRDKEFFFLGQTFNSGKEFKKEILRRNPSYKAADIQHDMKTEYQLTVPISKCFKARRIALDMVMQDQVVQFAKLWDYEHELRRSNPNTTTEIVIDNGLFNKFYICFEVLRNSWKKSCRPVIGLDGCFLKWELKGELLAAVGRDADNRIFPIAWAVVHMETIDSWTWFVQKLKADLSLGDGQNITILSDKQKGLLNAIHHELPRAEHRMGARHIYANWKKSFKSLELKCLFWRIATSFHQGIMRNTWVHWLLKILMLRTEPTQRCRAFFKADSHCKDVHNNLSESFNRTIKEARMRPMIDMLEEIRRQTMLRIAKRSVQATKCVTEFTPKIMAELEEARGKSRHCMMIPSGRGKYEVMEFGVSFSVDLYAKSCACRRWDLTGVPCQHAITMINEMRYDLPR
ncbi:PREDICTED: uncharacterized protein LOC104809682 [Tarenaya hassleriana]|uniref:uncharacterized protein LOC104809682 n=1 Tax=Tarenaya hassleriana TaxID=28532 RepID=UPI00053C2C92|nr:PREDICTED: uncharacterized protein LOC104809682 [Tarenaya hassleriana]